MPFRRTLASTRHAGRYLRSSEFFAVDDVSFRVTEGECLGLIGHNGAGKTTLLMMLTGLLKPDSGQITVRGRVGALIALGAGFNPLLTARENILVNGAVLGLRAGEIRAVFDDIVDFAEIEGFVDTPVQYFSSGMRVRLGFAVASTIRPDLLFLDEVLAVGDERFQLKCYERISRLIGSGAAAILVSHQLQNIERICSRCIVLEKGRVAVDTTDVSDAVGRYRSSQSHSAGEPSIHHSSDPRIEILSVETDGESGRVSIRFESRLPGYARVMVSYAVSHKGAELVRTTTLGATCQFLNLEPGIFTLVAPEKLRLLSPLNINLTLWDHDMRCPLVWIRGITLACRTPEQPQLVIESSDHE